MHYNVHACRRLIIKTRILRKTRECKKEEESGAVTVEGSELKKAKLDGMARGR